jgi:1-acyl-sn-glycerol-3-phosphate acyltransferase
MPVGTSDAPSALSVVPGRARRPGFVYHFGHLVLSPLARVLYRPRIVGKRNVPRTGSLIFASNHLAFIDSVVIPLTAPRRVQFLAKSYYFEGTGIVGWVRRTFYRGIGAVGVQRGAGQAAQRALEQGRHIIEDGNAFAIYPEGTRSLDGRLYRGRTGVAWLALTTGAPVVPVGLIGTDRLQPHGSTFPRFHRITVVFGEPVDLSDLAGQMSGKARREATDRIMASIQALSGQETAGVYNEAPPSGVRRELQSA